MSKVDLDAQTPPESPNPLAGSDGDKNIKQAVQTLEFQTVGSDMIGREQRLGIQEWLNLTLDRECTPILYVYFAGIAILCVITAGIVVIVGLQCNWNFVAI
ncbi:Autophagy-related protein [Dirofilaria immitis]